MTAVKHKNWKDMPEGKEKYAVYLCSREWSVLKEAVKKRSGGVCERCAVNKMDHVHHLTYARKYCELLEDLQACCKSCHDFIHGKSDCDPARERPAVLPWCGTKVKTVYLAGKISGTDWRSSIVAEWGYANHSTTYWQAFCDYEHDKEWAVAPNACEAYGGIRLHYSGPWWMDLFGGHGCVEWTGFPHGYSISDEHLEPLNHEAADDRKRKVQREVSVAVSKAIIQCDLLFAWIDSTDCYGTLVEIGFAKGLGKPVAVAVSRDIEASQLWLASAAATYPMVASSAKEAWSDFWGTVELGHRESAAAVDAPTAKSHATRPSAVKKASSIFVRERYR